MANRSSTSHRDHGRAGTIVRWVVFTVFVLLLLLALTPAARGAVLG